MSQWIKESEAEGTGCMGHVRRIKKEDSIEKDGKQPKDAQGGRNKYVEVGSKT